MKMTPKPLYGLHGTVPRGKACEECERDNTVSVNAATNTWH